MPGIADKFTPSAQGRLLWPGMTAGFQKNTLNQTDEVMTRSNLIAT
jgi:hypothetical protein